MSFKSSLTNKALLIVLIAVMPFSALGQSDRQVEEIKVSENGEYSAGFMYWYGRELFPFWSTTVPELILLGEVIEIDEPRNDTPDRTEIAGRIKVEKVVKCPQRLLGEALKIETLSTDAFYGLDIGDRILVFMIPYEGAYAIPNFTSTNCSIGFRLPYGGKPDVNKFVSLFSSENGWNRDLLTLDELRLWTYADPWGTAWCAIDRLEGKNEMPSR